ncbi:unnamed protein product, partial [Closterium sp. NIES-53]
MVSLRVLAFDHEGRPIQFDTWLDDLQLYLLSNSRDSVSLFDHTSRAAPAPLATADSATHSQTAQALYDAVVARYSSPATAALGRLLLTYLFPELSAFATVEDLVSHLRTSDARYRAALLAKFLAKNPPPLYITLYFIVTRLPESLRAVRDHFLALDPTALTIDLLEQHLLAVETSIVAVGASHGTPRTPFFDGCSPSPLAPLPLLLLLTSLVLRMSELLPLVGSAATARARVAGVVEVAAGVVVGAAVEVVAAVGVEAGVGALVALVEAAVGVAVVAAVGVVAVGLERSVEVLEEARGSGSSVGASPFRPNSLVNGCFSVG